RKATAEHRLQDRQRANRGEDIRLRRIHTEVRTRSPHWHVTIDQTGHHRLAACVDHARIRQIDRTIGDFDDMTVFDHDVMMFEQHTLDQIEYVAAADYRNAH